MVDEDVRSLFIDIHKPKIYAAQFNKKMKIKKYIRKSIGTFKKPSDEALIKYSILNEESLPLDKVKRTNILLPFKIYSKAQHSKRFKQRNAISVFDKYKLISTDLKNRLFTDDPKDDVLGVTDTDEEYLRCINGRPLNLHIPVYKSLIFMINEQLRTKHAIGIKKDCILNIETNHKNELTSYNLSVKRFTDQTRHFDGFIADDYRKSKAFLEKWDKLKSEVDFKVNELQYLAMEKFTIVSRLINLDYKFSIQQKYGRFLYYLSPPSWRLSHRDFARSIEIEAKGFDFGKSNEDDTFTVIFDKLYKICFSTPVKAVLYFNKPNDLMELFGSMEKQQLYYFTHVNHLAPYVKMLKDKIRLIRDIMTQESSSVARLIKDFECLLDFTETRCAHLETKFFKILNGMFYESTAATDVLKFSVNLQFCFEKVFNEKASNMDILSLAKSLEKLYMDYSKKLDAIKSDSVRLNMNRCMEIERNKYKKAKYANKELRLFDRLEQELFRAHGISPNNQIQQKNIKPLTRPLTQKCRKHKPSKSSAIIEKCQSLTEVEIEYLTLFTDWNQNEDPSQYLQSIKQRTSEENGENK